MSELQKYEPQYTISFFSDQEKSLRINKKQFDNFAAVANSHRFVELNGELLNVADIRSVIKDEPPVLGNGYPQYPVVVKMSEPSEEAIKNYENWKNLPHPKPKFIDWLVKRKKGKYVPKRMD